MTQNRNRTWLISDHLGSTSLTVDASGNLISSVKYSAFGEIRSVGGVNGIDYRYTGQREEMEIGLYFYQARFYDPYLNHFIQPDTIIPDPSNPQSWNRYAYVNNNPVRYSDPSGHVIAKGCSDPISCGAFSNIYQAADYIYHKSVSDEDFLVNLYTTNYLPGETAKERTKVIFDLTYSDPYQHFGVNMVILVLKKNFRIAMIK